jgi:hypothetical protein
MSNDEDLLASSGLAARSAIEAMRRRCIGPDDVLVFRDEDVKRLPAEKAGKAVEWSLLSRSRGGFERAEKQKPPTCRSF